MAQDLIAKNHDKALKFDHTQNQLETQNLKVAEQENQLKITQSQLENMMLKYKEIQISHETIKQREGLLEEDKSYLKRQNDELSTRKNELEKINNDLMDRNLRLQSAREDLGTTERLVGVKLQRFSKISPFLEGILMEHKKSILARSFSYFSTLHVSLEFVLEINISSKITAVCFNPLLYSIVYTVCLRPIEL